MSVQDLSLVWSVAQSIVKIPQIWALEIYAVTHLAESAEVNMSAPICLRLGITN